MKCPICSSEIPSDAVVCTACGATQVTQRSPVGVIVGWVGMVIALLMVMLWAPVVIFPLIGMSLSGYPWAALIIGTAMAAGMMWYSKSTRQSQWVRRGG